MKNHFFPDDVFVLPLGPRVLIHSPLQRISAVVNQRALEELEQCAAGLGAPDSGNRALTDLIESLATVPSNPPPVPGGPLRPLFLSFIPTRACNMSCRYCDFGSRQASEQQMDPALAVAALDWMADHVRSLGRTRLDVHFFGGEPLAAGEVVDVVVHRTRALAARNGWTTHLEISTNGLCDDRRARFLGEYLDAVVLSLDGFQESHDLHRPVSSRQGSFDRVIRTAEVLSRSRTELCLRCCISEHNVHQMPDIAVWFCEAFQPSVINFETVLENPETRASGLHPPDPMVFARNFLLSKRAVSSYGIPLEYASAQTRTPRHSLCPVGQDALMVSPDGRVSGCYLPRNEIQAQGLDLDVGQVARDRGMDIDIPAIERIRKWVIQKPLCRDCFCRWSCAGGCHVKQAALDSRVGLNAFCVQTRVITGLLLLEEMGQGRQVDLLMQNPENLDGLTAYPTGRLSTPG